MEREEDLNGRKIGEDYILKGMPNDERRYQNSEIRESNDENWTSRSRVRDK